MRQQISSRTLSEHLRKVGRGQTLTVLDRETQVARIVPVVAEVTLAALGPASSDS